MPAPATLLVRLDADWSRVRDTPALRLALSEWGAAEPALRHTSPQALVDHVRAAGPAEADAVLAALAARAGAEEPAARVLLHLVLPALVVMAGRYRWLDADERAALVVAAAYERIRTYPIARRPRRIAANIVLDTRKRLFAALPSTADPVLTSSERGDPDPGYAAVEARHVLHGALRRGDLDAEAARLLWLTHGLGLTSRQVAAATGMTAAQVRQRCSRAARRTAAVVQAAGD